MVENKEFETETMAGIYASQGHYRKAVTIYHRLLAAHPDRKDLEDKLLRIEAQKKIEDEKRLTAKISEWVDLLMKRRKLDALKYFRSKR